MWSALRSALSFSILIPDKMSMGYLGFVLLLWFPGVLHAQSETQPCPAPGLSGGYLVPEQDSYPHETTLTYACDNGLKPAVEGWWATSRCQNGNWFPTPQCIDEKACLPTILPNANYDASTKGWYDETTKIWVRCDAGYEHKDRVTTAKCTDGTWSSMPICEKSDEACGEPPKIPHAVVIHQEYQELFEADTKVQYECEDGYTAERADTKTVICISGNWTEGPTCNRRPDTGHGGATVEGTGGGHTTSAGSGTNPADRRPDTGHGGATVEGTGGGHTTSAGSGTNPADRRPDTGHDGYTERGTGGGQPTGGVTNCGTYPSVLNGDVVVVSGGYLKYQCSAFYKLEGPDTVICQSNGKWTEPPSCRDAFCVLDPAQITIPNMILSTIKYVKEGEDEFIPCIWDHFFIRVQCVNRRIHYTKCCHSSDHQRNVCR
ncbi:complement factor H-like isoform X4 [Eleginops maclovinus]|uniref:complement factor H-like isoform X4 n=1 Tax=Eleginops maclovinus TaxID=56733 RepID=UPI003080AA08